MSTMSIHTCPICGWRASVRWIEHLASIAQYGIPRGHKLGAVIVACPECLPPQVVPRTFIPGRDFWRP